MQTGKQIKDLINKHISDDDIVCFGEEGDKLGVCDRQITRIEQRDVGFEGREIYKAILTKPFNSNGAMKFWKE